MTKIRNRKPRGLKVPMGFLFTEQQTFVRKAICKQFGKEGESDGRRYRAAVSQRNVPQRLVFCRIALTIVSEV